MQRIVFKVQHSPSDKENCLNMLPNTVQTQPQYVCLQLFTKLEFTLLKVSPSFFEKNKQIPTTTAKPSLNVLNSYLNPQTIWAFLCISRELSFPQQHFVMDGRAFVSSQMAGPAPLRRVRRFPICTRLGKVGRKKASSSDHRKGGLVHCPATSGSAQLKDKTPSPELRKSSDKRQDKRCRGICAISKSTEQPEAHVVP